jgi:phosphohistidine phosphatase
MIFDRPLNDRGNSDAPRMAKILANKGLHVDAIISSTANRAFTTASYFAKELGIKKSISRAMINYIMPLHMCIMIF